MNGPLKGYRAATHFLRGAIAFLVVGFLSGMCGVRINITPSLPQGFYIITRNVHAPLVEFCPSAPFSEISAARGYRLAGVCPDGAAPLLKPVVAVEGDLVDFSADGLRINARPLPNTAPFFSDSAGRRLTPWPYGAYRVQPGTIWVASSYNQHSFDSRYFGPIRLDSVRHRLRLLWTPFPGAGFAL